MKKHLKLLAAIAAVGAVAVFAVATQTATADGTPGTGYVCAPGDLGNPIGVLANDTSVFPTWDSFATGYTTPSAETSVPTGVNAGKYYLTCTQWTGWTQVGTYVLGDGSLTPTKGPNPYLDPQNLPIPGVYPVIQQAAAATS